MKPGISHPTHIGSRRKWFPTSIALALTAGGLAFGLLSQTSHPASAAAAPVAQCNNDTASNVGGQGIACIVTIDNYVTGTGVIAATPPSTVTVTRCVGAAGPIAAGAGTCTTTTTTSAEPVTLVQQCNGSGNGGGGVVRCSVTVINHFSGSPTVAPAPAAIYQCVGSVITGTGAPGTCTPANTPGVTSVTAATVGQCNGSGNGGTSVGFVCTVTTGSTETSTLAVNIDQCNGSGNGGGALVTCTATVTNDVVAATATATPTASPTATPTGSATVGSATATPTGSATAATSTPTGSATAATPAPTGSATAATPTPTASTTQAVPRPPVAPRPPATGNAGPSTQDGTSQAVLWLLGITAIGLVLVGVRAVSRPKRG